MDCIYQLILKVKDSPNLFVPESSIYVLKALLDGYSMRNDELSNMSNRSSFLSGFQEFVSQRYKENRTYSWATIIHEQSNSPQEELEKFFSLVDEFVKMHPVYGQE